jgi:hypothetical protein
MVLLVIVSLALVFGGLAAQKAQAIQDYEHGTATACADCHSSSFRPATNADCIKCHTGYQVPTSAYTCWTCHTPGQDMQPIKTGAPASCTDVCHFPNGTTHQHNPHPERGTCTTCHNLTTNYNTPNGSPHHVAAQVTTVLTAKVSPTTVKVGKTVVISGTATPAAQLAGAKVSILVNLKVGTKWVKAKAATATAKATGAYSYKYKVAKKGSYQVKVSVKATATYTAKSVTKTFKAK